MKDGAARFEPVTTTMLKMASSIVDRITQHKGSIVPPFPKPVPRRPLGAKFGSSLERLANMKSNKVDSATKVAPRPNPSAAETDSPTGNEETFHVGTCEKSNKLAFGEAAKICALLKPDMFEDMDLCAKFVDGVKGVVYPSSFTKHTTEYRKIALLTMMQKTSMLIDQNDTMAGKEVSKAIAAEAYSSTKKIMRLESELVTLKGSNISASTSL
ncbi:hypothetical protein ACFX2B_037104 [Malus domestica]